MCELWILSFSQLFHVLKWFHVLYEEIIYVYINGSLWHHQVDPNKLKNHNVFLVLFFICSQVFRASAIKMGRIFLDHIGGTRLFSCANCDTILTNRSELISTRFTGATGRAFLFNKVCGENWFHFLTGFSGYIWWQYQNTPQSMEMPRRFRMRAALHRNCLLVCLWDFRKALRGFDF